MSPIDSFQKAAPSQQTPNSWLMDFFRLNAPLWLVSASLLALAPFDGSWTAARAATPAATNPPAAADGPPPQQLPITARACLEAPQAVRPVCIALEVPRSDRQYAMGLQRRGPLPQLQGMWFGYQPPAVARFWMHQTPEPLDMLFVRAGKVIQVVAPSAPCMRLPCRSYGPDVVVDGVLEIGAGQAAALGIGVGTALRIESLKPAGSPGPGPSAR
ncbi:MAG: DUF192 domain-containing protein [Cyanobacteria bacterium]|nr:DUF192 domain-containing protein [Cyanobacteriota bacterium]